MGKRRVVVTGMGIVSPLGNDLAGNWDGIVNGRSGIGPVEGFDAGTYPTRIAGEIRDFDVTRWVNAKDAKKMDHFIHYGIAASLMAKDDAGLEVTEANAERIGALIGAGIGGIWGIEETAHPEHAAFDPLGQLLSVVWLGALTYALIAAGEGGWLSPTAWPALLLAGVGLLGFLFVERRTARPLLPLGLFRQAGFAVCNLASFVLGFSGYASLFFLSLFFQQVQGASAQQAGFYLAPQFLAMGALSMLFGRLQRHVPLRRLLVLGYLVIGLAMLALAACGTGTAYPWVGLLLVALGLGMGLAVPGTGLAVMASVARERSGMASATMNTLRQAGMAVGIALLGALLSGRAIVVLGDRLEELGIADAQRLATQAITAHRLPGSLAGLDAELPAALAEGFRLAMLVAGASALLAAALLWRLRVSAGPAADTVGASGRTAGVQLQADRH